MQLAGKLVLASSIPTSVIYGCGTGVPGCNPYNSIGGGIGGIVSLTPHRFIGYKDLDLQLTKNFTFFHRFSAYARVDAINVFNWHNYADYNVKFVNNVPVSASYNRNGGIIGVPFTIRLSAGVRFGPAPPPPPVVAPPPPPPEPVAAPPPPPEAAPPPPPPPPPPVQRGERGQ
jgi:hypothetical protein